MANAPLPLIAGNWKMNGLHNESMALAHELAERHESLGAKPVDIVLCPPFTLLSELAAFLGSTRILVGAQDCSPLENGAHTGDVSAEMVRNAGCACCIVGHSERRRDHGEADDLVKAKGTALLAQGVTAII